MPKPTWIKIMGAVMWGLFSGWVWFAFPHVSDGAPKWFRKKCAPHIGNANWRMHDGIGRNRSAQVPLGLI